MGHSKHCSLGWAPIPARQLAFAESLDGRRTLSANPWVFLACQGRSAIQSPFLKMSAGSLGVGGRPWEDAVVYESVLTD